MPIEETMLIRYSCKDMGLSCFFYVKGEKVEEVTQKALDHIKEMHADEFNTLQSPAEIEYMLKVLARSTRVVAG
jgi:predicted small metal-binding protein